MPSEAIALLPVDDPSPDLDFYRTRDDVMRAYQPATAEEQSLAREIAYAELHLRQVFELKAQVTAKGGLAKLFTEQFAQYKQLMRDIATAERMWYHAIREFDRARKRRTSTTAVRRYSPTVVSSQPPVSAEAAIREAAAAPRTPAAPPQPPQPQQTANPQPAAAPVPSPSTQSAVGNASETQSSKRCTAGVGTPHRQVTSRQKSTRLPLRDPDPRPA